MRPITHRLNHVMTYVSLSEQWDYTRIAREKRAIRIARGDEQLEEGEEPPEPVPWATEEDHPLARYLTGSSRFDLETVREYLLPDANPIEFKLRRASLRQWGRVVDLHNSGRSYEAHVEVIAVTLDSIRGLDLKLGRKRHSDPISDEVLQELRLTIGDKEFALLGHACLAANAALTSPES